MVMNRPWGNPSCWKIIWRLDKSKLRTVENFGFATSSVPDADYGHNLLRRKYPVNNSVRSKDYLAEVFVVLFRNNAAKFWKGR